MRLLWAKTFKVSPLDEKFSQVTVREAMELIHGATALDEVIADRLREKEKTQTKMRLGDTEVTVRRDDEARKLADTPHLTGDPEWDAIELAATDPSRPPIEKVLRRNG